MWVPPIMLNLCTLPMKTTILTNKISVFSFHGILKCNLLNDQVNPIRIQIGGRKKPPIMMCRAHQEVSNTNMRDVIHPKVSSIIYLLPLCYVYGKVIIILQKWLGPQPIVATK